MNLFLESNLIFLCVKNLDLNESVGTLAKYGDKNLLKVTIQDLPYNVHQILNTNVTIPGKFIIDDVTINGISYRNDVTSFPMVSTKHLK